MIGGDPRDRERLHRFLTRIDRRERLRPVVRGATVGALLSLAVLVLRAAAGALGLLPGASGPLLVSLALLLPLAGAAAGYRRPDLRRAAATGDRRAELADLLKTAHGFVAVRSDQESWRPLLERRAAESVASLAPARVVPTPWRQLAGLGALLLACLLVPRSPGALLAGGAPGLTSATDAAAAEGQPPGEDAGESAVEDAEPEPPEPIALPRLTLTAEQLAALREAGLEGTGEPPADGELAAELSSDLVGEPGDPSAAARGAHEDLLQEVRRQLEEEETLPALGEDAGDGGQEPGQQQGPGEGAQSGPTAPSDPDLQHRTDELTTIDAPTSTPSAQASRREAGVAQVAVPAGVEIDAGDQPTEGAQSGDPGSAESGSSTAPQDGFVDPLGAVATELDVTLELALLESRQQEAARETSREMTPSRAGEATVATSGRRPVAPTTESAAARPPVAWRHRQLVRRYFDPNDRAEETVPP